VPDEENDSSDVDKVSNNEEEFMDWSVVLSANDSGIQNLLEGLLSNQDCGKYYRPVNLQAGVIFIIHMNKLIHWLGQWCKIKVPMIYMNRTPVYSIQ
jgi:hypothetical protein